MPKQAPTLFVYRQQDTSNIIVRNLILAELRGHGFVQRGSLLAHPSNIIFHPKTYRLSSGKQDIVLRLNNEYFCTHTLMQLLNFRARGDEEQVGLALAQAVVAAGLTIPPDAFIHLFEQVFANEPETL
ncbi:hypothetical protein HY491_00295 [Candidatus Woesearchaeota archaeon]|nr:hypothetical protein [Candidatus Woesearchaeota archaeon]